ncbi:hypothetical protein TRFO_29103 [Tritrichomonas foetus]|uniref:Leucine Rich Repeat family protein n=1 Tax=Tritrichomonas foetus TaxID=1144522 RepID=A0A1J4JYF5_9EUKA|nr:hypothetical protein TRFO_29103 [Tritrichomonas foetus]|eukprot:OHT03504.1 hypothetical protein TRFO_29103 [Tritrichomonas foetus]
MSDKPLIFISQQQIEAITQEYLYGPQEQILFAGKVRKLHLNGGEDSRILVITIGAVYLFKSRFSKGSKITEFNLVDVEKVSYIKPNIVTFISMTSDNKVQSLTVKSDYALDIGKNILLLNKMCKYKLGDLDNVKIESTPPSELTSPPIPTRPPNALQARIIQMAHKFNHKFPLEHLNLISDWDKKPVSTLRITSAFNAGLASRAVVNALAWDVAIQNLVLDNFASSQLQTILQTLFTTSKSLTRLSIDNYKEPPSSDFDLPSNEETKLIELSFRSCHIAVIFTILHGLRSFKGRFHILTIGRSKLNSDNFKKLFEILNKMPCFMAINNLRVEEGTADGLNVEDLGHFLAQSRLKIISVSRTSHDISSLLNNILPYSTSLRSINLINGRLFDQINQDITLPNSLAYLDLTKSQVSPAALEPFMKAILSKPRSQLLTLNISDLATSASTEEIVQCFNIQNAQPIIAEFIFAGNEMRPSDLQIMIGFFKTQTRLSYLNLSRCFKDDIDESLALLSQYIINSNLAGLEITCSPGFPLDSHMTKFIESIIGKSPLHALNIDKSGMGDNGLKALKKLVEHDIKMTSLNCDGANPQTPEVFNDAYEVFSKLDRVAQPKSDLALLGSKATLPNNFGSKLPPKTLAARVAEYESFDASSPTMLHPMDALMGIINTMSDTILKKKETDIFQHDIVNVFKRSLITTSVPLKPNQGDGTSQLFTVLDPNSNTKVSEPMSEYKTIHD